MSRWNTTLHERLWSKIEKGDNTSCWLWRGAKYRNGYGMLWGHGRLERAHRLVWMDVVGTIPEMLLVLHKCDNRACCNPNHLFLGTQSDNIRDMYAKQRHARGDISLGSRRYVAKLTEEQVVGVMARFLVGKETIVEISRSLGVHRKIVDQICKGGTWTYLFEQE